MKDSRIDVKVIISVLKSLVSHRYNCNEVFFEWICNQALVHLKRGIQKTDEAFAFYVLYSFATLDLFPQFQKIFLALNFDDLQ